MSFPSDVKSMVNRLLGELDTPRSLAIAMMVRHREWEQLAGMKLNPVTDYLDTSIHAEKFSRDMQATDLLRKCADLPSKVDKTEAARQGWLSDERANAATNARLDPWIAHVTVGDNDVFGYPSELSAHQAARIWNFIQRCRKDIKRVLGPRPILHEGEHPPRRGQGYLPDFRFGPGTALGFSSDRLPWLPNKLATTITVTTDCEPILSCNLPHAWRRSLSASTTQLYYNVTAERWSTVPKSALTERTIGIQPLGNLAVQNAIGRYIRRRLRYSVAGIDLEHGQSLHARKAREASLSNEAATIDLESASNSMTRNVLKLLLPADWYWLLDAVRTRFAEGVVEGRRHKLEMFSAMGNGFTFEVETLLFWAICRSCGVEKPLVYGDDIIVPAERANDVIAALAYFGFRTNPKKTFKTGPFRESCGGVFFLGRELKTYRMENFPNGPLEWMAVHNGLWRSSRCFGVDVTERARLVALHALPSPLRRMGGPEHIDGVLHGRPPLTRERNGIVWARRIAPMVVRYKYERFGGAELHLAMALYGIPSTGYAPRSQRPKGYRRVRFSVS